MKVPYFILVFVFLLFSGCAPLHIYSTDSTGTKIAKGVARIPVAVFTGFLSEIWHMNESAMESWVGSHESKLFMSWGAPAAILDDGSGGHILVYTENRTHVKEGKAITTSSGTAQGQISGNQVYINSQTQSYTTYTPAQVTHYKVYRQFRVDSTGIITGYSWRGL